eukprot:TRINITY_DN474_c0_g1_i1.p1 TRINITY_DN474_c0_g1~~TRINITY_DN474_c0_g1_i1.p1  ORF type:complete len:819 (+),score=294.13 TRINITY_DN474_c0_g1_i1:204-2459(+)
MTVPCCSSWSDGSYQSGYGDTYTWQVSSISSSSITICLTRTDVSAGWGQDAQLSYVAHDCATTEAVIGNACASCPAGQYASNYACQNCTAGNYCSSGAPVACPRGSYCPAGTANPIPCALGTYNPQLSQTSCLTCGFSSCCPPGSVSDTYARTCSSYYAVPDGTSSLVCSPAVLSAGATATCVFTPRRLSQPIVTSSVRGSLVPATSDPGLVSVSSLFFTGNTTRFGFTVTAGTTGACGVARVQVTLFSATWPALLSVAPLGVPTRVPTSGSTTFWVLPRDASGASILAASTQLTFSSGAAGGSFLVTNPGYNFTFLVRYTAATVSGAFNLTNNLATSPVPVQIYATPDATSVMNCQPAVLPLSATTVCSLVPRLASSTVFTISSLWNFTESPASPSNISQRLSVSPAFANLFNITYRVPSTDGIVSFSNGYSANNIYVYDTPDETSVLSCPAAVSQGFSVVCSLLPRRQGRPIYTLYTFFNLTDSGAGGGTFNLVANLNAAGLPQALPSPFGANFSVQYTAGSTSGFVTLRANLTQQPSLGPQSTLQVMASTVDATTTLTCPPYAPINTPIVCTLVPRRSNVVVSAPAQYFNVNTSDPTRVTSLTPLSASVAMSFTFTLVVNSTGPLSVSVGLGAPWQPVVVGVYDFPDSTSNMSCVATTLASFSSTTCTITPQRNNRTIYALSSAFSMVDGRSGGSFTPLSPVFGNSLSTTWTSGWQSGPSTLSNSVSSALPTQVFIQPDASSSAFVCA